MSTEPRQDEAGFEIRVVHAGDNDAARPIVQSHLHALMAALLDEGITDPSVECGPLASSVGVQGPEVAAALRALIAAVQAPDDGGTEWALAVEARIAFAESALGAIVEGEAR